MYALGQVAAEKPNFAARICDFFHTLVSSLTKNIEVSFTIGESICALAFGLKSRNMNINLDIPDVEISKYTNDNVAATILNNVLDLGAAGKSAASRKASCIWLLCLCKYGGSFDPIRMNLNRIHIVFSSMLADKDGSFT